MKLGVYKKEQGRTLRIVGWVTCLVLILWGLQNFYSVFPRGNWVYKDWLPTQEFFGLEIEFTYMVLICAGIFLLSGIAFFFVFNWPKLAEFLIETEGELKKVSWPERKEYVGASIAVLVVVLFIVFWLYVVDYGLHFLLTKWKIGF